MNISRAHYLRMALEERRHIMRTLRYVRTGVFSMRVTSGPCQVFFCQDTPAPSIAHLQALIASAEKAMREATGIDKIP